jgi:hypothetical protein
MYPLSMMGLVDPLSVSMGGVIQTSLIFLFFDVGTDPDGSFDVLCFTFFLPKRYLPIIVILGMLYIYTPNIALLLILVGFEAWQYGCRKRPYFALSMEFYLKINSWVPSWIKKSRCFVDCEAAFENLESICEVGDRRDDYDWAMNERIVIQREEMHHSRQPEFKHHWINKGMPEPEVNVLAGGFNIEEDMEDDFGRVKI